MNNEDRLKQLVPLEPRITKSSSTVKVMAMFPTVAAMLKRFTIAYAMANLWDGERDGIREAVKTVEAGTYDDVVLSKSTTAPVVYVNADGKYMLENCLQCSIPKPEPGTEGFVIAFSTPDRLQPAQFLDQILHHLQNGKDAALKFLTDTHMGSGVVSQNEVLYDKKGSEKNTVTILPPNDAGSDQKA